MLFASVLGLIGLGAAAYITTQDSDDVDLPEETNDEEQTGSDLLANFTLTDDISYYEDLIELTDQDEEFEEHTEEDEETLFDGWSAGVAVVDDYIFNDEALVVVWDDMDGDVEAPDVILQADPDNEGELQIMVGDQLMTQISGPNALGDAEIALIPQSSIEVMELLPIAA